MDGDGDSVDDPAPQQEGVSHDEADEDLDSTGDEGHDVEPDGPLTSFRASWAALDPLKGFREQLAAMDLLKGYREQLAATDPLKGYREQLAATDPLKSLRAQLATTDPLKGYREQLAATDPLKSLRAQLATTDPLKGYREQLAATDPLKSLRAQLATSWVAPFNAQNVSARISRAIASELLASTETSRRARVVDQQFVSDLVRDFSDSAPDLDAPEVLAETLTRSADPLPLAQDSLLSDEEVVVESWIASLLANFLAASGLTERDLLEDSVAAIAYMATMAVAVAILINYPALLVILAPTGIAGKDPAAYMSRLARRGFRRMNES